MRSRTPRFAPRPVRRSGALCALVAGLVAACGAGGCSNISSLDGAAKAKPLAPPEQAIVREQVKKARDAKEWTAAWDQEVAAGADRATLEQIAIEALRDDSGAAGDMFEELRKTGPLSESTRRGVAIAMQEAEAERRWSRAVEIAIVTAEDPPEFSNAWAFYRRAPANKAADILEEIRAAKDEWAKEKAEAEKAGEAEAARPGAGG